MCSLYQAIQARERDARPFGVEPPVEVGQHDAKKPRLTTRQSLTGKLCPDGLA